MGLAFIVLLSNHVLIIKYYLQTGLLLRGTLRREDLRLCHQRVVIQADHMYRWVNHYYHCLLLSCTSSSGIIRAPQQQAVLAATQLHILSASVAAD